MATLSLRTLGSPCFEYGDGQVLPLGKPFALLTYVAAARKPVSRDELANLLWPALPRDKALQSVRQALFLLRKALDGALHADDADVSVDAHLLRFDLEQFSLALDRGDIAEAQSIWRGEFLQQFTIASAPDWSAWVEGMRDRLAMRYGKLLTTSSAESLRLQRVGEALTFARLAIGVQPLELQHWCSLITLLLHAGDVAGAATALSEARRHFDDPEFAATLEQLELRLQDATRQRHKDPYRALAEPELVGRASELSRIEEAWSRAVRKQTQIVSIVGASGMGKSRLADEGAAIARQLGGEVIVAKASAGDEEIAFATLSTVVGKLMRLPGARGISGASEAVLTTVAPRFAKNISSPSEAVPAALGDALIDLIGAVSFETPLFVIFDDLQWADAQSRTIVRRVIREIQHEAVLFCIAYRTDELQREVGSALRRLEQERGADRLELSPLSKDEIEELLGFTLHFENPADCSSFAEAAYGATDGQPYLIAELLQRLADEQRLRVVDGKWTVREVETGAVIASIKSVRSTVQNRIRQLNAQALAVAGAIALQPQAASLKDVQRAAGMDAGAFTRTIGELVEERVLRWQDDRLIFTHDQVREELQLRGRRSVRRHNMRKLAIVTGIVLAAAVAVAGFAISVRKPLYGGGSIVMTVGDSLFYLSPPTHEGGTWRLSKQHYPAATSYSELRGVYVDVSGTVRYLEMASHADSSPYPIVVDGDGTRRVLARRLRQDSNGGGISPDGQWALFVQDNPETRPYDLHLYKAHLDGSNRQLLRSGQEFLAPGKWSPDGTRIATYAYGPTKDTLIVMTPSGLETMRAAVPYAKNIAWCDERTIILAGLNGTNPLTEFNVETGAFKKLPGNAALGTPACSTDGRTIVFFAIDDGLRRPFVLDRVSGDFQPLAANLGNIVVPVFFQWLPERPRSIVTGIRLKGAQRALEWGETIELSYEVTRAGSGPGYPLRITWATTDTSVVSVDASGRVTANRPGRAGVIVIMNNWLADTTDVVVRQGSMDPALFRESFDPWKPDHFHVYGSPAPVQVLREGERVLLIPGDGNYSEGILTRADYALPRGGTVELEFKMPLTRRDRQSINFQLVRGRVPASSNLASYGAWDEAISLGYPAGQLMSFTPDHVLGYAGGISSPLDVKGVFRPDEWNHLAIQVRADGRVSFFVNRKLVGHALLKVENTPGMRWRIDVKGSALDTELLVRNLVLWGQPKF